MQSTCTEPVFFQNNACNFSWKTAVNCLYHKLSIQGLSVECRLFFNQRILLDCEMLVWLFKVKDYIVNHMDI